MKIVIVAILIGLGFYGQAFAFGKKPTSNIPNLTDVVKDGGGKVVTMDQTQAAQYCQNLGLRLPTIRELALWTTHYGAKVSGTPQNGYDEICGADSAGNPETFYYRSPGNYASARKLGQYWYWSSSSVNFQLFYVLGGYDDVYVEGADGSVGDYVSVRCVQLL